MSPCCHPVCHPIVTLSPKSGTKRPRLQHPFKGGKTQPDPSRSAPQQPLPNPQKSPQNRPFTAIPRAKYNLSAPRLNFCNKKRAPRPSKIKPKFNFWYSLFCISYPAIFRLIYCFSGNFRAKFCFVCWYNLFCAPYFFAVSARGCSFIG